MGIKLKKEIMKLFKVLILFLLFCSCKKREQQKRLDIWENIQKEAEVNNLEYLLKISNDTLDCLGCNNGQDWATKQDFFNNHMNQIYQIKNKSYTYYVEKINGKESFNKRYRINYEFKNHNLIYTIIKNKNGIRFQGVFSIP